MATRRKTRRPAARPKGRVYRCKGRTATGRIMKGYRLTRGGLVKVTARKRSTAKRSTAKRSTTRRRRGNGAAINMAGLFPDRRQLTLF